MKSGLLPLPEDKRDYQLGAVVDLPALETLPSEFSLESLPVRHQKDSDFCTAFTYCEISGLQENVELEPSWSFAMTKAISGDHESYGSDLRTAAKSHVKYGGLKRSDSPYSLENKPQEFLRNPEVWSYTLMEKAEEHKKRSYFAVTGRYDHFDNIRASLYSQKSGVAIGVLWGWPLEEVNIDTIATKGFGHAIAVVGWDGDYLRIKQSYGEESGEDGFQYIHRDVINHNVDKYGAFMLLDLTQDTQDEMQTLIAQFIEFLIRLWRRLV